jgi:SH3-like domain-containing protein
MKRRILTLLGLATLSTPAIAEERAVPYWASIAKGEAMMRAGPDRSYPGLWIYKRRDLPIRVLQIHGVWRRVEEQDGTRGWMLATLLAARRTGIVTGGTQAIREAPDASARLLWQAEPGVIGRLTKCDGRWCHIQIDARQGYVEQAGLWGTSPGEAFD